MYKRQVWWAKRRRKIVRRDNGKVVEFEEVRYGMLMMVLCDREIDLDKGLIIDKSKTTRLKALYFIDDRGGRFCLPKGN